MFCYEGTKNYHNGVFNSRRHLVLRLRKENSYSPSGPLWHVGWVFQNVNNYTLIIPPRLDTMENYGVRCTHRPQTSGLFKKAVVPTQNLQC